MSCNCNSEIAKDIDGTSELAYAIYCHAVGGVAFNGDKLPNWEEFSKDPSKSKQCAGWRAVGKWVADCVDIACEPNPEG